MLTISSIRPFLVFNNRYYKIEVDPKNTKLNILMTVNTDDLTTKFLPLTDQILQSHLPTIAQHKCFNNYDLPFSEELKNTEVGHLFEHIILEYLSLIKFEHGHNDVSFSGETRWDWRKEQRGTFHIDIKLSKQDLNLVKDAIEKAVYLMDLIMSSKYSLLNLNSESKISLAN